jgi:chaperone LolA
MFVRVMRTLAVLAISAAPLSAGELENAIRAMSGSQAGFVQKFTLKGFKKEQRESGRVVFGNPPQMRWTYSGSEQRVFVFDGNTSWLYTPGDKQVIERALSASERRDLPMAFLWDGGASSSYNVKESKSGKNVLVRLTPKTSSAALKDIRVTINPADHRIRSLDYTDRNGNRTVFEFSGYAKAAASGDTFRFKAPAGVTVVKD